MDKRPCLCQSSLVVSLFGKFTVDHVWPLLRPAPGVAPVLELFGGAAFFGAHPSTDGRVIIICGAGREMA